MGFLGFKSKEEKNEEKNRQERINKAPIYFTAAVDFKYSIIEGGFYTWSKQSDFKKAYDGCINALKEGVVNFNGDAVIDVKVNINHAMDSSSLLNDYIVVMTGVVVKRIEE